MKILHNLLAEKCRESYILKDGRNEFFKKYPYILAEHPSRLYELIMTPEGIPNEILPGKIWLGNGKHVALFLSCLTFRLRTKELLMLSRSHMCST